MDRILNGAGQTLFPYIVTVVFQLNTALTHRKVVLSRIFSFFVHFEIIFFTPKS